MLAATVVTATWHGNRDGEQTGSVLGPHGKDSGPVEDASRLIGRLQPELAAAEVGGGLPQ